jgi:signal transduction histidine kinase
MERWEHLLNELRAELTLREQELDLLHDIDLRLLASGESPQAIFNFIVGRTQELLQASHTTVLLRRSTFLEPMYSNLMSVVGQRVPIAESITGLCLETDKAINIPDISKSECRGRYEHLRGYEGPPMHSLLATPIRIRGTAVGVLNAESTEPQAFNEVHERIAAAIAAQVGIALQRTQTLHSSELFADVDKMIIGEIGQTGEDTIQQALEEVMSVLQRIEHVKHHRADILFIRRNDESGGKDELISANDELEIMQSTTLEDVGLLIPVMNSVSGRAIRENKTIIVGDVTKDEEYQLSSGSIRSEIAVPIYYGGEPIGVLNVESEEEDAFYGFYQVVLESFAEKVKTLMAFAKLRADVIEAMELRTANDLLVAVGDQTSHIVHQLNNTVGAMRARIMELQEMRADGTLDMAPDGFLEQSLTALLGLAERTLQMPDDVTKQLGHDSKVDMNECVRRVLGKIERGADVRVEEDLQESIPALPLYSFDIVVQNLVQNALDAMPGGGTLTVRTCAVRTEGPVTGYVQLTISDTGMGIPPEVLKRVFELNFTTKRSRGKGLGLGLWWVRNFVRRAKGDIAIRSVPGSGTEVSVKIPIGTDERSAPR